MWVSRKDQASANQTTSIATMAPTTHNGTRRKTRASAATCMMRSTGESWWLTTTAR